MATQGLYPSLVDPRYAEYADAVDRAIQEDRLRRTPRVTEILQPKPENSALTDIGHGLARGVMVTAPEMFGQAAQAFGADAYGKSVADAARERGQDEAYRTTGALGEAASMLPTMVGIGATALIPGVGQVVAPAASAALFGGAQYTQTREKGGSVGQALGTAAVQSVGQAIGGAVAGKLVSGAAGTMQKMSLDRGFRAFADPSLYGTMARGLVHAEAAQLPTQAAAAASVAGIESGLPDTPSAWEAAKHSFAPTALLTAAMTPFGAPAIMRTNRSRAGLAAVLQDPTQTAYDRAKAAETIARELRSIDVEGATRWQLEALAAINNDAVPELRPDYKFDVTEPPPPPPPEPPPPSTSLQPGFPEGQPPQPPTPLQDQINALTGVSRDTTPQYPNRFDADLIWKHAFEQRAQEEVAGRQQSEAYRKLTGQLIVNTPPGVMSFPEWHAAQKSAVGGPLAAGGAMGRTQASLQNAYLSYVHTELRQREDIRAHEQQLDQTGQHNLFPDLAPGIHVQEHGPLEQVDVHGAELPTYEVKEPPLSATETYNTANKQDRASWLKSILGSSASRAINKMTDLNAADLATVIHRMWHAAGGEADSKAPKYVPKLEDLFKQLTGKDIRENPPEKRNAAKTAADKGKGAEPQPAADATGAKAAADAGQVVAAAGDAQPGVGNSQAAAKGEVTPTTEEITLRGIPEPQQLGFGEWARTPEGQVGYGDISLTPPTLEQVQNAQAIDIPAPREVPFNQHPAEVAVRNYEVERAKRELEKERQGIFERDQLTQEHQAEIDRARQAETEAAANLAAATPELRQVEARLSQLDSHSQQLGQLREMYNEVVRGKQSVSDDLRQRLQKAIGDAAAIERANEKERKTLEQRQDELSDIAASTPEHKAHRAAMERTSRVEQQLRVDAAADPTYYTFTRGLEPDIGVGRVTNLMRLFSYIEANKYAGSLKDLLKQIPDGPNAKDPNALRRTITELAGHAASVSNRPSIRRTAQEALASRDSVEHKQMVEYATQLAKAVDTMARINGPAISAEKNYQAALKEYYRMHAEFDRQNKKIEDAVKSGTLTVEEASVQLSSIEQNRAEAGREFKSDEKLDDIVTKMFNILHNRFERDLETADREKTGLSRINNDTLGAVVVKTPYSANALEHIAQTNSSRTIRAVAKLLAAGKPTAVIRVIENPDFNGGRYIPSEDVIEIGRGGMNTTTMLHEITHALTHAAIIRAFMNRSVRREALTEQGRREVAAFNTIGAIMDRFRTTVADPGNPEHQLALKNEHEFISEALNNPEMQQLLGGRANLLTRVFDVVRDLVPAWKRARTDFEELMRAAPTLFGNPNRNLLITFRNPLNYTVRDPFTAGVDAIRKLGPLDWLSRKTGEHNIGSEAYAQLLKTSSTQQQRRMFTSLMDSAKRQFPEIADALGKFDNIHQKFRDHFADRSGVAHLVLTEGNDIATRAHQLRTRNRTAFDEMGAMGTQATIHRIDAAAKTLAEAQKRNPTLTPEEWNSKTAIGLRNEYRRLEGVSAQIRAKYGKDAPTPISMYHEMVDYQDLLFTRGTAENMSLMLRTYGAHLVPDIAKRIMPMLDTKEQAGNGPRDIPAVIQQAAINRGMKQAMGAIKDIRDAELAAGGKGSKGAVDAASLYGIMEESYAHFMELRQAPYMHIGRPGDKMIGFTVTGGDAEWNEVSKLMNATRENGGLERGMGASYKGNRGVFMKFDNDTMYREADTKLRDLLDRGVITQWHSGPITEKVAGIDSATPNFIKTLRDSISRSEHLSDEAKKEVISQLFDTYLQQLPDNSPLKASASRDGFSGYSTDYIRSFSDRATMSSQSISRLRSASRVADTLKESEVAMRELRNLPGVPELKTKIGLFMTDLRNRADELNRPVASPAVDRIRALTAFWRLGISPSYWTTIMYQPWQVTMPVLGARYGYSNTLGSMSKNFGLSFALINKAMDLGWLDSKDVDTFTRVAGLSNLTLEFAKLKGSDGITRLLSDQQLDLLNHVQWQGVLNFGQVNQIARIDPASKSGWNKFINTSTIFPHYIEVSNRLISALSAHELYMGQHAKGLTGEALAAAHAKAKDYAVQVIRDSDGDHSQANVARRLGRHPNALAGRATPLLVGFQYFFIGMFEMMAHKLVTLRHGTNAERFEAAKVLGGVSGMTALMAGTLGLPFMGPAMAISNLILGLFRDENDDPPDAQLAVRQTISKMVGGGGAFGGAGATNSWSDKAEEVLARGIPRLAGIDVSTRSGLQDLLPFSPFFEDRRKIEDKILDHAFDMLGPAVGMVAGVVKGVHAATQGDWPKAINDGLPTVVRGFAKAYRQANYGYETEGGGNQIPIAAPSAWNLLAQTAGFTSGARAEQGEASYLYKTNQQLLERRHQEIRTRMYRAYEQGDFEELGRLMQDETQFLMRHPQFHLNLRQGLQQRAEARAVGEMTGTGILANKRAVYPIMHQFDAGPQ